MNMPNISEQIISLCQKPNTALRAIHWLIANNGASESAFCAGYDRVMMDNEVNGADYWAVFAQKVDDLPFDGVPLIDMVINGADKQMKLSLIDKMPKEMQLKYLDKI